MPIGATLESKGHLRGRSPEFQDKVAPSPLLEWFPCREEATYDWASITGWRWGCCAAPHRFKQFPYGDPVAVGLGTVFVRVVPDQKPQPAWPEIGVVGSGPLWHQSIGTLDRGGPRGHRNFLNLTQH